MLPRFAHNPKERWLRQSSARRAEFARVGEAAPKRDRAAEVVIIQQIADEHHRRMESMKVCGHQKALAVCREAHKGARLRGGGGDRGFADHICSGAQSGGRSVVAVLNWRAYI